ncbi:MAG TPA: MFS transporter [Tepidisphaeraceae bacterium]|jgi:MFS family permease
MAHDVSASSSLSDDRDEPLPGARVSLVLLLAINLFNYIDRQVLAAVEPQIRAHFFPGASEDAALAKTGLLASAFLFSYMVTAPVFGWLADRMSRWIIVGFSVILWSLATGASGLAGTFTILLITRCFVGVGEAGYGPAAPTIIADLYPLKRRGAVLSWFYLALPIGAALGYVLGGLIASKWGWRYAFYAVTPPGLLLGALAFWMREPRNIAAAGGAQRQAERGAPARLSLYLSLARIPSYVLDTAGLAGLTFAIGGISYFMPAYLVWREAGSLARVNTIFGGILVIAGFFGTLLGGWMGDRLRKRFSGSYFLVSGAGILIAAPFVLALLVTPFPAAWALVFVIIFFLFFNTGPANAILANVTRSSIRATAFAMNIFIIHLLGDFISPPLLGKIAGPHVAPDGTKVYRWNSAFVVVAGVMVLAGVFWMLGARYLERDTANASQSDAAG